MYLYLLTSFRVFRFAPVSYFCSKFRDQLIGPLIVHELTKFLALQHFVFGRKCGIRTFTKTATSVFRFCIRLSTILNRASCLPSAGIRLKTSELFCFPSFRSSTSPILSAQVRNYGSLVFVNPRAENDQ